MDDGVYRDSLSAWKGLREIGGLEPDVRDEDLVDQLRVELDPEASSLEDALASATTDVFLQALFRVIQPFSMMFRDVLDFFKEAGAREGQSQWKLRVDNVSLDLQHFEDFLEHWSSIGCAFEVPAIDWTGAFIPTSVLQDSGTHDYLLRGEHRDGSITFGQPDVDDWLSEHNQGRYAPFPKSLHPNQLGPGLDDAARLAVAALDKIRSHGLDRKEMLEIHSARTLRCVESDALHILTIAQNETDFWLRSTVICLAEFARLPKEERREFGAALEKEYAKFPRRLVSAEIEARDLQKLLSLPVWKKRYELYGVWVATNIVRALEGHEITIKFENGELEFAFREAEIADVETAEPKVRLISERRTCLSNPVGKGRTKAVQPDFGLWTCGLQPDNCVMVVEVKHYKRRSRRNFRDVLIDYANAHPQAPVILVNYGPVGSKFDDLPPKIEDRCRMIGPMNPENPSNQEEFRKAVRKCVGDPPTPPFDVERDELSAVIVVDSSMSMRGILQSSWFKSFVNKLEGGDFDVAVVDSTIREIVKPHELLDWLGKHEYRPSTFLSGPVEKLIRCRESVSIVTDKEGLDSLKSIRAKIRVQKVEDNPDVLLLQVSRHLFADLPPSL